MTLDNQKRKPGLFRRLRERFRRKDRVVGSNPTEIGQGPDPADDSGDVAPSGGPPSHWLEKVRPGEPPAHWLESIRRITAEGMEPRPFEFTANANAPVGDEVVANPKQPATVEPDVPAMESEPVADLPDNPLSPAPERNVPLNPPPRFPPPADRQPARTQSLPESKPVVQPLSFRPGSVPRQDAVPPARESGQRVQSPEHGEPGEPFTIEMPPPIQMPDLPPARNANRESQADRARPTRDSLYGYLPLPQYDLQMPDESARRGREPVWQGIQGSPPGEPAPVPRDRQVAVDRPDSPPVMTQASRVNTEPQYQRLIVNEEGIWPELMADYTDYEPEDRSWERIRREWARQERLDREQRGLPRLD